MIKEIIIDPDENVSTNIVEDLSQIDLTKDSVIVYKYSRSNGTFLREVKFNVDQFDVKNIEELKAKSANGITNFFAYTRIKMMLPIGLFPEFRSELKGVRIKHTMIDKIQGIDVNEQLNIDDKVVNIKGVRGFYSCYNRFSIDLQHFDHKLFQDNNFRGLNIPIGTDLLSFRLVPHFVGRWPEFGSVYLICSSYLHDRFPNF